jgi:nucleoside-diphosphate kinase
VLEGEEAIQTNRRIMGATDPAKADAGTIRRDWGTDVEKNAAHGSDGPDTARWEISYFFSQLEIQAR